jgi:hypothetical protein
MPNYDLDYKVVPAPPIKAYGGVNIQLLCFLTLEVVEGEPSASPLSRSTPAESVNTTIYWY